MSTLRILDAFDAWREARRRLVLVTVYDTEGSTYSKAGHRILIADNDDYQGLVSGGCLEGDLAGQARTVLETGQARALTYDLRDEADELWGLGIGCNGIMRLLLQPLEPASGYEPFNSIARLHRSPGGGGCALVIASESPDLPVGACAVAGQTASTDWLIPPAFGDAMRHVMQAGTAEAALIERDQPAPHTVLCAPVAPLPRLLVLGAGPDAVPLVNMASELGWLVTVADHRPAYAENPAFRAAAERRLIAPGEIATALPLNQFAAAVVMSHHLETDRRYLAALARTTVAYVGLLGPRARRDRLLSETGLDGGIFGERLRGPVGLEIGADSPESIALSILADIQRSLKAT